MARILRVYSVFTSGIFRVLSVFVPEYRLSYLSFLLGNCQKYKLLNFFFGTFSAVRVKGIIYFSIDMSPLTGLS